MCFSEKKRVEVYVTAVTQFGGALGVKLLGSIGY